ncbi:MAG: hypothetical protein R3B40_20745 [Polyangiales bacterium]|nr:hypothetical protein [Myxococcales bacterium]MCB9662281.1 hypothetical protein [Sandaracinaceae bacterium]
MLQYALPLALGLSLAFHAAIALTVSSMATAPQLEFEFGMPDEVEFGMTEAMDTVLVDATPVEPPPPAPVPEPAASGEGDAEGTAANPPQPDAGVPEDSREGHGEQDAGVPDTGPIDDRQDVDLLDGGVPDMVADAGASEDASVDAGPVRARIPVANATIRGPARIPAGAQLALRLDMARLRQSVVAEDVRALIAAVPDWQELLGGSGIDPLTDLERVLIATPNRYRSRIMVAGRHVHDEAFTRAAVDRMAAARGTTATWSTREGVPVAPWANEGETPREVALLSPQHFTISRPEDLAVVLAMTQARAARAADEEGLEEASGPDVLLSMGPNEGLSLEVEGVHAFLMGGDPNVIPVRARLAVREVGPRMVGIDGLAVYPSEQAALDGIAYWTAQRDAALRNAMARIILGDRIAVLESFTFEAHGERVIIRGRASAADVRFGLDLARRQFEAWAREAERRRAAAAAPGGSLPRPPTGGSSAPETPGASAPSATP